MADVNLLQSEMFAEECERPTSVAVGQRTRLLYATTGTRRITRYRFWTWNAIVFSGVKQKVGSVVYPKNRPFRSRDRWNGCTEFFVFVFSCGVSAFSRRSRYFPVIAKTIGFMNYARRIQEEKRVGQALRDRGLVTVVDRVFVSPWTRV